MDVRWPLASLWESMMVGEEEGVEDGGRFLREPFWLGLFVLWTVCDLSCTLDSASLTETSSSPSAVRWSLLEAAVRGSWPLLTGVLVFEGAFPFALRGWGPPLLRARGSPFASLRAMVLSQGAGQGHSSGRQEENKRGKK